MVAIVFLIVTVGALPWAQARVFSFDDESVAPFVNFRAGMSSIDSQPFRWQSASSYSGDEVDLIYGGEFGLYLRGGGLGVAIGVLVQNMAPVTGATGSDASGNRLFQVDVEGISYGGSIVFDYQFAQTPDYLWKVIFGGGYQFAEIDNTYSFTASGQALVGGQTTLTESYKNQVPFAVVGIGTEFVLSGTTTLNFMLGYHHVLGNKWSYGQGGENFAGAHSQGGDVLFEDATNKTIDWSYPFLQIGLNFYVDTLR